MNKLKQFAFTLALIWPTLSIAQNLHCPDITRTLKTFQIDTQSSDYLKSVFSQNCQQDGSKKSSGGGLGLDTLIKTVPVKFTGNYSSAEEGFTNFCRTYASLATSTNTKNTYKEFVSDKALATVDQCLALQASGVQITHDMTNVEALSFYLRSSVTQSFELSGISTTGNITCSGQIKGKLVPFDKNVNLQIKATQSFACNRNSDKGLNGTKIFDEATVTILTNQGNYSVLLPRDERLPENAASLIKSDIGTLRSDLATSTALLHVIADAKAVPIYQCPVGWVRGGGPSAPWASYGCQGQVSASSSCIDIAYPNSQALQCTPLGSVRPY